MITLSREKIKTGKIKDKAKINLAIVEFSF